ncbi:BLUF domain-containing protein [Tateyamaria pelophila]|uniref:BLUF domain-containing protein n=1 Tax=Tateyamaria pelophila TaxID=328415 RepID=UPI001CBB490F|nr:BLUF domain-containing protein [Tateyamaria pelophila]
MNLIQLVYVSRPFGYDAAMLSGILLDARRLNARNDITGALVCRHDIFLQMLEGPELQVTATYDRIRRDDRHVEIRKLVAKSVQTRMFSDWAMLHDPEKSWIWTSEEIADGALDRASPEDFEKVFADLSRNVAADQKS